MTGRGGLVPSFWGSPTDPNEHPNEKYYGADNQIAAGYSNPFRRPGYLAPSVIGLTSVTASGATAAAFKCSIIDASNTDFYVGSGQYLWKATSYTATTLTMVLDLGASADIRDLQIYEVNGTRKIFVIYSNSSGNLQIAISSLAYDTGTDDLTWLTATVSGSFTNTAGASPFMINADNGFAYLFNANQVHKVNGTSASGGTNGTITANVIQFPALYSIVDAVDHKGYIYMAIHQYPNAFTDSNFVIEPISLDVGVGVWNRSSTDGLNDYIPVTGAKAIHKVFVAPNGRLRLIVTNTQMVVEIREFDGYAFKTIAEVERTAFPTYRDSFAVLPTANIWLGNNGAFYAYGAPTFYEPEGLFKIYPITTEAPSAGATAILMAGDYTLSTIFYLYSSGFKYYGLFSNSGSNTQYQGDVYTKVHPLPPGSTVRRATVYMPPVDTTASSTTAGTLKFYFNQSATAWASKTVTRADIAKGYVNIEINKPFVNSIQIETEWPNSQVIFDYEFNPYVALVDYDATTDKR